MSDTRFPVGKHPPVPQHKPPVYSPKVNSEEAFRQRNLPKFDPSRVPADGGIRAPKLPGVRG